MPFAPSSVLAPSSDALLVAPSSVLAPSSDALRS